VLTICFRHCETAAGCLRKAKRDTIRKSTNVSPRT
jgi:hypothetical protein